jgi:hypothetical protein
VPGGRHRLVNDPGKRPDAVVRFDPKTETLQSWPITWAAFTPVSSGTCVRPATATS